MPEQDVVAFWDGRAIVTIDQATGEAVPVEGVDYPCDRSDRVLQIETAHAFVSCGQTGLLYWALTSDRVLTYANINAPVITPLDTSGRTEIWTGDAHNGVAAVGGIWDCCIAIASTETGALLDEFHGTEYHFAISADGWLLATTSAGMTAIWDISEYIATE